MRPRFWVAFGALALALVVLAPALTPLSGSMDAFSQDLANGTFRPFGEFGQPAPLVGYSGSLGGFTGDSGGGYVPGAADVPRSWVMDRDGRAGEVVIDEVFDPGLGAMKRLKAYDRILSDGQTLDVASPQLRPASADPTLQYALFIEGSFRVQFRAEEPIPIFSPHPKARIESFSTDASLPGSVTFFRDGADTLYALAHVDRVVTLNVTFRVSRDYYSFDAPPDARVEDYRYGPALPRPVVPARLQEDARLVLARAGVRDSGNVKETVDALAAYFRSFTEGDIPPPTQVESLYLALALGERGCCRHRAFAFMVTAQAVGIPTRVVVNEAHAFVEVATPDGHWHQINLGGCGTYRVNNPMDSRPLFEQAEDPRTEANPEEGRVIDRVVTFTNITESPARIVKGETYHVNGTVQASDGRGVPGARIDVYLNETKTSPGKLSGTGTTDGQGRFSVQARVPATAPARAYQLVARAVDGRVGTVRYAESWSDPPVEVFAPTTFRVLPVTAAVGFPSNVTGRLTDLDGNGVPNATIRWSADGAGQPDLRTDAAGRFVARLTFDQVGNHTVDLRFDGTTHHGATTGRVPVNVGRGAILLAGETPVLVRGEGGAVPGHVAIQGTTVRDREVRGTATFALGRPDAPATRTDEDGAFLLPVVPARNLTPGAYTVRVTVPQLGLSADAPVRVAARPVLTLDAPETVGPGSGWAVVATLRSDNGTALPGVLVQLTLDGNASSTRELLTNRTGVARFELPSGTLGQGTHAVRVAFPGDAEHVGAALSRAVVVELPWYSKVPPWAYAALLVLLAAGLLAVPLARRSGAARRALGTLAARVRRPERRFLSIAFPDHPPGVPPVFEPGETARVRVTMRDGEGRVVRARVGLLADGQRHASDGEFAVPARAPGAMRLRAHATGLARLWTRPVEARVPVASYRKAVEDGFVALRARADLPAAATPGDLVARLDRRLDPQARARLREAAALFDVADYSERPVDRAFYHAFARAAASVRDELEEVRDAAP